MQARYAGALAAWSRDPAKFDHREFATLRQFGADVALLRHGDHVAARLRLEHAREEREQLADDERVLEQFWAWAKRPEVMRALLPYPLSEREKKNRIRAIFGLPPEEDDDEGESDGSAPADPPPDSGGPTPATPPAVAGTESESAMTVSAEAPPAAETKDATPPERAAPALGATDPALTARLERVRRLLFDELPNAPPQLVRLGARAKAAARQNAAQYDPHAAAAYGKLFAYTPVGGPPGQTEEIGPDSAGGITPQTRALIEEALHLI